MYLVRETAGDSDRLSVIMLRLSSEQDVTSRHDPALCDHD